MSEQGRWEPVNPIGMVNDEYGDAEIKLCYWQPGEPGQQVAGLDAPDGAGWYAYERFGKNVCVGWVYETAKGYLMHSSRGLLVPSKMQGKFYKLTMPWDSQPGQQTQLSLERAVTELYQALATRENCENCGGNGWQWTEVDGEAEAEPCTCSNEAFEVLLRYQAMSDSQPGQQASVPLVENMEYRHIIGLLQDESDRIDNDYSDDPEAAKLHKQDLFQAKRWLDRVAQPKDSQPGQQVQLPDDEQVCDECLGDGELENHSHLAPPIDGDWPMISCWKCNGTGIEQQDAQPSEQQAQLPSMPDDVREALQMMVNIVRYLPNISPGTILGRGAALETAQKWLEDAQPSEQEANGDAAD